MSSIWGYRPRYYLTHPLKAIKEPWNALVFFFQRGKRGWAISDTWNMDMYLARVIGDMLAHLAVHNHGCPYPFAEQEDGFKQWDAYLAETAKAFCDYLDYMENPFDDRGGVEYHQHIERMRALFDHYASLGD